MSLPHWGLVNRMNYKLLKLGTQGGIHIVDNSGQALVICERQISTIAVAQRCLLYFNFTLSTFWTDQSKGERRRKAIQPLLKHQPMKYRTLNQGLTTTPGTPCPTLFDKCVGSLTTPANRVTLKMQQKGPTVYSLYARWLERPTICRCHYTWGNIRHT